MESKRCPDCGETKTLDSFPRNRSTRDGRGSYCKPCHNTRTRENRELHGGPRNYHFKRRYGITAAEVDALIKSQDSRCRICNRPFTEELKPVVDHDHDTGEVRGILCDPCNRGLGQFGDSSDRLRSAIRYLEAQ